TLAEDRRSGDTIRGEGAQRVAARCADRHRRQDLAGLWPAALRPVTFLRGSDEPAEWRTARREYEPPSRGPCIHAEQDHDLRAARASRAGRRSSALGSGGGPASCRIRTKGARGRRRSRERRRSRRREAAVAISRGCPGEEATMNYNFTDRVRKVLAMAREEAIRLQHDYVGTEHILLGLIREGEGMAAAVLMNLNVDLE